MIKTIPADIHAQTPEELHRRIADLEQKLAEMEVALSRLADPLPPVFIATYANDGTWTEQTVVGTELTELTDGRACLNPESGHALRSAAATTLVMEIQDGDTFRYVRPRFDFTDGGYIDAEPIVIDMLRLEFDEDHFELEAVDAGSRLKVHAISPGGSLAVYNESALVDGAVTKLRLAGSATQEVMIISDQGDGDVRLQFTHDGIPAVPQYKVIAVSGGKVVWDWVRAHDGA